ncbi:MAG: ABATE domain-containing protein, partial [Micromonosporaceae bacterium]
MSDEELTDPAAVHGADAAPGSLAYVEQFVNTRCEEYEIDETPTPEALGGWLRERRLLRDGVPVGEADHEKALRVREGLRALIAANNPAIRSGTAGDASGPGAVAGGPAAELSGLA